MALSEEQRVEVQDIADLKCRRHMDELLERTLPRIIEAAFSAHNDDVHAHETQVAQHIASCAVAKKVDRILWLLVGLAIGSGLLGGGVVAKFFFAP